jgi:DNA-binding phage protein
VTALSPATRAAIRDASREELQAIADMRMDRLHTETETAFLLDALKELARRNRVDASAHRSRAVRAEPRLAASASGWCCRERRPEMARLARVNGAACDDMDRALLTVCPPELVTAARDVTALRAVLARVRQLFTDLDTRFPGVIEVALHARVAAGERALRDWAHQMETASAAE